jgi:hypothetical protein
VSVPDKPESSPSSEAVSARAVYDDIVHRINTLQATLDPDEKIVLSVSGVSIDVVGLRGSTISGSRSAIIRAALWSSRSTIHR